MEGEVKYLALFIRDKIRVRIADMQGDLTVIVRRFFSVKR
jgi:hypothetical protein